MRHILIFLFITGVWMAACDSSDDDTGQTSTDTTSTTDTTNMTDTQQETDVTEVSSPLNCPADVTGHAMVQVGDISLNVACRGAGPTIVFLHGFPEFSYAWEGVINQMAANYRLVAPDQRGFNLSDKPEGIPAYHIDHLVADIVALLETIGGEPPILVGHDWGGPVAWVLAHKHPDMIRGLVIVNGPHPDIFLRELENNPEQKQASAYIDLLLNPGSEDLLAANDFGLLKAQVFNDSFSEADRAAYVTAWSQPGALPAMVNWYRANMDFKAGVALPKDVTVDLPTLVLWGMKDTALLPGNLTGLGDYVTDLKVVEFPEGTHWIEHEDPEGIANAIDEFVTSL